MERCRLQEGEDTGIYRWPSQFHHVIDKRISSTTIGMQEAARQIESSGGERLTRLPFEDGTGDWGLLKEEHYDQEGLS